MARFLITTTFSTHAFGCQNTSISSSYKSVSAQAILFPVPLHTMSHHPWALSPLPALNTWCIVNCHLVNIVTPLWWKSHPQWIPSIITIVLPGWKEINKSEFVHELFKVVDALLSSLLFSTFILNLIFFLAMNLLIQPNDALKFVDSHFVGAN